MNRPSKSSLVDRMRKFAGPLARGCRVLRQTDGQADAKVPEAQQQWLMLLLVVSALAVTVIDTWNVWNVRTVPVNLPLFKLPGFSFGWVMLIGLLPILWRPRWGALIYGGLLLVAIVFDQYRLQPQFIGLWVLLLACCGKQWQSFCRWYLASLWLWAGLHKLLAFEWTGVSTWALLEQAGIDPTYYWWLTILVIAVELFTAVATMFWHKVAAVSCLCLHLAIFLFLSPFVLSANSSVWAWNVATAIVGAWLFWRDGIDWPRSTAQWVIAAVLLISPVAYYFGWLNPRLSHMLYVEHMPKAWSSSRTHLKTMHGWGGLSVPMPDSPRLFVQAFESAASPGDKLAIRDPRWLLSDRYFVLTNSREAVEIDRRRFFFPANENTEVAGIQGDDPLSLFRLRRANVDLRYDEADLAIEASWYRGDVGARQIQCLQGLPNLRVLTLKKCTIDSQLGQLKTLPFLEAIAISDSAIAQNCFEGLDEVESLRWLELSNVQLDDSHIVAIGGMAQLNVLRLNQTNIRDVDLEKIAELNSVTWLDLSATQIGSDGVARLQPQAAYEWIDLRRTQVDDRAVQFLAKIKSLQRLDLTQSKVSLDGVNRLKDALPDCRIVP